MPSRRDLFKASLPFAAAASGLFGLDSLLAAAPEPEDAAAEGGMKETSAYFSPSNFFANGEWKLPKLPYAYNALEPSIDAKTMEIHHTKHHQAYVTNLNKATKALKSIKGAEIEPNVVESLQRDISFNLGGHTLHSIFWAIIGPNAAGKMGGDPSGTIAQKINATFGDYVNFKAYFTKVATSVKGSGWAVLAHSPIGDQLVTYSVKDQDSTHAPGTMPILGIDVWEHAYYLKYQNDRAAYVKAWFDTINWDNVNLLLDLHSSK